MADAPLAELLARLPSLFPESHPLVLVPSADGFAPHAERYAGGHAARWFAATDGQRGEEPFADAHSLCSLAEALEAAKVADGLRAEPNGYWVEPQWLAIASDHAGQHFMIDDVTGRVLAVAHDDDAVAVIAESPEAWLTSLVEGHAKGTIVWDEVYGLIDAAELALMRGAQQANAARAAARAAPLPTKHKIGLALTLTAALGAMALFVWYLETHR